MVISNTYLLQSLQKPTEPTSYPPNKRTYRRPHLPPPTCRFGRTNEQAVADFALPYILSNIFYNSFSNLPSYNIPCCSFAEHLCLLVKLIRTHPSLKKHNNSKLLTFSVRPPISHLVFDPFSCFVTQERPFFGRTPLGKYCNHGGTQHCCFCGRPLRPRGYC